MQPCLEYPEIDFFMMRFLEIRIGNSKHVGIGDCELKVTWNFKTQNLRIARGCVTV